MQIGMIGLGRMGANMVRRLMRGGHECVVYDVSPEAVQALAEEGAAGASSLDDFARQPEAAARRVADGAGRRRGRDARRSAAAARSRATSSSTAATRTTATTSRRAKRLAPKGIHYVDCGTSGGVWGLERGYCLMIGGEPDVGAAPRSDLRHAGAGRRRRSTPTPGREQRGGTAEQGYLHCGPNGAGHFVKMVHNGIEYGLMAAYAEGLNILRHANVGKRAAGGRRRDHAAARSRVLPVRPRPGRRRRGVAARQRHRVLAARSDRDGARCAIPQLERLRRPRVRLGRGALDARGRHRRGRARARAGARRSSSASAPAARRTSQDRLLSAMRYEFGGHSRRAPGASDGAAVRRAGLLRRHAATSPTRRSFPRCTR